MSDKLQLNRFRLTPTYGTVACTIIEENLNKPKYRGLIRLRIVYGCSNNASSGDLAMVDV